MIERKHHLEMISQRLELNPVVAIIGARQVGKSTLAGLIGQSFDGPVNRFDLENPEDLARLAEPQLTLDPLEGLVVLDEIQRLPDLFPLLRVLVDRPARNTRFLVLGSASPDLLRQSSESLAGRISYYELPGFNLRELSMAEADQLWLRGGFPRSFLAPDDEAGYMWRQDFIRTYLERDLPVLGITIASGTLRRFWTMLAHCHGQVWNASRLAASLGVAHTTTRSYLDILCDTFIARQLPPYIANIGKRQIKSPKVYLRDTGLLHALLGIRNHSQLITHPVLGASWEGFAMTQVIETTGADDRECFFWSLHSGAELDLLIERAGQRHGYEFKRTLSPVFTRAMRSAVETLELSDLTVVYPGTHSFPLAENVMVKPLAEYS